MQVFISCSDGEFPTVPFTVTADTLVRDAVEAAVDEWGVGFQNSELSCAGVVLPELSTLVSHGIEGGTQLEVLDGVLGCSFEDIRGGSEKIEELLQSCDEEGFLSVNMKSFVDDEDNYGLCPRLTCLSFVNGREVIDCPGSLIRGMRHVQRVRFPGLRNVRSVGYSFASCCESLTDMDLSGLSGVESIGKDFLGNCKSLKTIDLSPLVNLRHLNDYSMSGCSKLTSIDMNLPLLENIPDGFLYVCSGTNNTLTSIDLSGLQSLRTIGNFFLTNHVVLTELDLSMLVSVKSIGDGFLRGCTSLKFINLSGLTNTTSLGNDFLSDCVSLEEVDLSKMTSLTDVGESFLADCSKLTTVSFDGLSSLRKMGKYGLAGCTQLTAVDLTSLPDDCDFTDTFLLGCDSVRTRDQSNDQLIDQLRKRGRDAALKQLKEVLKNTRVQTLCVVNNMRTLEDDLTTLSEQLVQLEDSISY